MSKTEKEGSFHELCTMLMEAPKHCDPDDGPVCSDCQTKFNLMNAAIAERCVRPKLLKDGVKRVYQIGDNRTLTIGEIFATGGFNHVWAGKLKAIKRKAPSADKEYSRDTCTPVDVIVKASLHQQTTSILFIDFVITALIEHPLVLKPVLPFLDLPRNEGRERRMMAAYPRLSSDLYHIMSMDSITDHTMFQVFLQVASCLQDLQTKYKFMHRDLKHTNVLYKYLRTSERVSVCGVTFEDCHIRPYLIDMGMASMIVKDSVRIANDVDAKPDTVFRPQQDLLFFTANMIVDFHDVLRRRTPDFYAFLQRLYSQDELLFAELEGLLDQDEVSSTLTASTTARSHPTSSPTSTAKKTTHDEEEEADEDEEEEMEDVEEEEEEEEDVDESSDYSSTSSFSPSSSFSESSYEHNSTNNTKDNKIDRRLRVISAQRVDMTDLCPQRAILLAKEDYESLLADIRTFGASSRRMDAVMSRMAAKD